MTDADNLRQDMLQMFAEAIGLSGEEVDRLKQMAESVRTPSEVEVVRDFLEEDWRGFQGELEHLLRLETNIGRVLTFEHEVIEPDDEDVMLLPDARSNSSWHLVQTVYAPLDFIAGDPDNLRAVMDISTDSATCPKAFSVWVYPATGSGPEPHLVLFFRDTEGAEEYVIYDHGMPLRMPQPADAHLRKLIDASSSKPLKDQTHFASMLSTTKEKDSLQAMLSGSGADVLSDSQLAAVLGWLGSSKEVRDALMAAMYGRVSPVLDEGHQLLRELSRGVADFMDTVRHEARESLLAYEKNQEKRLKGLHSDVDKMRMITDGVRKRADRTDSDNQALRRRVRELEARQAAGDVSSVSVDAPCADGDTVRRALDAFF
jgi:hypothetical protein